MYMYTIAFNGTLQLKNEVQNLLIVIPLNLMREINVNFY